MQYKLVAGRMVFRTSVHVGSGDVSDLTHSPIRRNAAGEVVIPGTAIAGALRTLLTTLAPRFALSGNGASRPCKALRPSDSRDARSPCGCVVCRLFGDVESPDEEALADRFGDVYASRLLVFDARPTCGDSPQGGSAPTVPTTETTLRDGVGVDRRTGATASHAAAKFDTEVVPSGASFELRIELRGTLDYDEDLLAVGLTEWAAGRGWIGGGAGRGFGAFSLSNVRFYSCDLDEDEELVTFLETERPQEACRARGDWLDDRQGNVRTLVTPAPSVLSSVPVARTWVHVTGTLKAEGPFLTADPTSSGVSGFDHAPLLSGVGRWPEPVLPGSGIRGVLRSHAERILRTIATLHAADATDFATQCPACDPLERDETAPLTSCDRLLQVDGVPSTEELPDSRLCLTCRLFGSPRRGSRLVVEDGGFVGDTPVLKMLDFLAIDRFTGGGAEGLKFDALVLWKPSFRLAVHLFNPTHAWEVGLVALVLRDLAEGRLSLGFGASKGFGRVTVPDLCLTFGFITPHDLTPILGESLLKSLEGQTDAAPTTGVYRQLSMDLADLQYCVGELSRMLAAEPEPGSPAVIRGGPERLARLVADSYFGRIDSLYPKEVSL